MKACFNSTDSANWLIKNQKSMELGLVKIKRDLTFRQRQYLTAIYDALTDRRKQGEEDLVGEYFYYIPVISRDSTVKKKTSPKKIHPLSDNISNNENSSNNTIPPENC